MSKSIVDARRRSEAYSRGHGGKRNRRLRRELNEAIDEGLRPHIHAMTPRCYVMLMTMASAELGRMLKGAIRDELYERRRVR
jgi:hypothetical protein